MLWRGEATEERECPVLLMHGLKEYFTAWTMREKGILPCTGGWSEQPYCWIEAIEAIGGEVAQVQREQIEAMRRERDDP